MCTAAPMQLGEVADLVGSTERASRRTSTSARAPNTRVSVISATAVSAAHSIGASGELAPPLRNAAKSRHLSVQTGSAENSPTPRGAGRLGAENTGTVALDECRESVTG
jgi:hypothetical protein